MRTICVLVVGLERENGVGGAKEKTVLSFPR